MIRYSLIILLCVLLGFTSYLLYIGQYITINIQSGLLNPNQPIVQGGEVLNEISPSNENRISSSSKTPKVTLKPDINENPEELAEDSDIEVHLDPTVGIDINEEQKIASSYSIIGPRQFVLLTDREEPMVEINLDTGNVRINPEYELDEVSKEFWNSIGKKYPEVCFVESN